jgi:hypothetical protein
MPQISRIFDSPKDATAAANELKTHNFPEVRLATEPAANGKRAGGPIDAATATSSTPEAETYADILKNGAAVLSVNVPFGRGRQVEQILNRHGPSKPAPSVDRVETKESPSRFTVSGEDAKAAPFSTLLKWPVLTDPRPTTVGSLGDQRPTFPVGLLRSDLYISNLFGLPLLTGSKPWASLIHDPAPLSTWIGLPVLLRSPRPPERAEPAVSEETVLE